MILRRRVGSVSKSDNCYYYYYYYNEIVHVVSCCDLLLYTLIADSNLPAIRYTTTRDM